LRAKNVGKKIVAKNFEKKIFYSHEYREQKMGGKERAKQFLQKHTNSASKNIWKKIVAKNSKNFFYIHTNIVSKKWGEKRSKQFFQKHTNDANKKCCEKNLR